MASARKNATYRDRVLVLMMQAGYHGMTAAEAGQRLGISTQLAGARFLELRGESRKYDDVLIMRTVLSRALPGGRPGIVHILTPAGWTAAMDLKAAVDDAIFDA